MDRQDGQDKNVLTTEGAEGRRGEALYHEKHERRARALFTWIGRMDRIRTFSPQRALRGAEEEHFTTKNAKDTKE